MNRRARPVRAPAGRRDEGTTLIEVVVAFGVFAIFATGALTVLGASVKIGRDDTSRLVATNLASRELEITREAFVSSTRGPATITTNAVTNPSPLPGGTPGAPLVVDGVPYTVVRTAQWAAVDRQSTSSCDGSTAELGYLALTVQVSWPDLGSRPPVAMYTTLTPPKGTFSGLDGHIGLKVVNALGEPRAGVSVTATGPTARTAVTGSDGCALLEYLSPGPYSLALTAPGSVNPAGDPGATTSVLVQSRQLARATLSYDVAASMQVTFVTAAGFDTPAANAIPLSFGNSAIVPSQVRTVPGAGTVRTVSTLWPYPSGYQVWAGDCLDNDPQYVPASGVGVAGVRADPVSTPPGGAASTTAVLTPLEVGSAPGTSVVARQTAGTNCPDDVRVELGTVPGSGVLRTSLPYGSWTVSTVAGEGVATGSAEVTLSPQPAGSPSPYPSTPPAVVVS